MTKVSHRIVREKIVFCALLRGLRIGSLSTLGDCGSSAAFQRSSFRSGSGITSEVGTVSWPGVFIPQNVFIV